MPGTSQAAVIMYRAILTTLHTCHSSAKQAHCEAVLAHLPVYSASLSSKAHPINASAEISSCEPIGITSQRPSRAVALQTSPLTSTSAGPSACCGSQRMASSINGYLLPPTPPTESHPSTSPNWNLSPLKSIYIQYYTTWSNEGLVCCV